VIVERGSTPQQLGPRLNRSAGDIVRFLLLQGEMVTATQPLTDDISSVSYWYQTEPHQAFPRLPGRSARFPR